MVQRGPKPLPIEKLQARGSRRAKDRIRMDAAQSRPGPPEFPSKPVGLSPGAASFWDELQPILERSGGVPEAQGTTLERFCEAVVTWRELKGNPWADEDGGQSRWIAAVAILDRKLDSLAAQLGLNERRVTVATATEEKPGDWFVRFCKGEDEPEPNAAIDRT